MCVPQEYRKVESLTLEEPTAPTLVKYSMAESRVLASVKIGAQVNKPIVLIKLMIRVSAMKGFFSGNTCLLPPEESFTRRHICTRLQDIVHT